MSCNICVEKFNKSTRLEIKCNYCEFSNCRTCFQKYLLDTTEPYCMNCKKIFTREFVIDNCTSVFVTKELKKHRENVLLDREKSLMPATQVYVVLEKEKNKLRQQIKDVETERAKILLTLNGFQNKINGITTQLYNMNVNNIENGTVQERRKFIRKCPMQDCRGFLSQQWKCGVCDSKICNKCNEQKENDEHVCISENVASMELLNKDTKPCPECGTMIFRISGCFGKDVCILTWDGYTKLSQNILVGDKLVGDDGTIRNVLKTTSGIDKLYCIKQSDGSSYIVNSKHTLLLKNALDISVEIKVEDYIKLSKTSDLFGYKINKFGEFTKLNISVEYRSYGKYYGFLLDGNNKFILKDFTACKNCSQMFCVECHCAWNWNTGLVEKGIVHNPHYYEFLKKGGGNPGRNHGDIPCGGLPTMYIMRDDIQFCLKKEYITKIQENMIYVFHNCITHIQQYEIRPVNEQTEETTRVLRVNYMLHKLHEEEFKKILQLTEKDCNKKRDFNNIYQMFVDVSSDIFRQITIFIQKNKQSYAIILKNFMNEKLLILLNLKNYFNENIKRIGNNYKCVYPGIDDQYHFHSNYKTYLERTFPTERNERT